MLVEDQWWPWYISNYWWKFWLNELSCHKQTKEIMQLPTTGTPTPFPLVITIPSNRNRQKIKDFLIQSYKSSTFNTCEHQPLPSNEAYGGSWCQTSSTPHTSTCMSPYICKVRWKSWARPRCTPWCTWTCSCLWTRYLVPPNGSMCQEKREAPTYCGFWDSEYTFNTWDSPHSITIPPSKTRTTQYRENRLTCMERLL